MAQQFEFPSHYDFPPFFTIQPNQATKTKQLGLWRDLILRYHTTLKLTHLTLHDCPLFTNEKIDRSLSSSDIFVIVSDFVKSGNGEWEDEETKTRCRILWRKPEQLAEDLYDWAVKSGFVNEVCTMYELHSGEDVADASFAGIGEEMIRRAVNVLEDQGKATVFKGTTSDEDGVKFL